MNLRVLTAVAKKMKELGCTNLAILEAAENNWEREYRVESQFLTPTDLALMKQVVKIPEFYDQRVENRRVYSQILALERIEKDGGGAKIKNLEALAEAIVKLMRPQPHHWFFAQDTETGTLVPYFMTRCEYHSACPDRHPAHVSVNGKAIRRGSKAEFSCRILREHLGPDGMSVMEVMEDQGMVLESTALVESYEKDMALYRTYHIQTGEQFLARGTGKAKKQEDERSSWWNTFNLTLERDGKPSKVVMDDSEDWGKEETMVSNSMWETKRRDADEGVAGVMLPVHPLVRAFDLRTHLFFTTHVSNLTTYVYDPALADKLVLPNERKELINILIASASSEGQDIIRGKSGGVIILCSGQPGTGKTLTAEVYSEAAKRPLYVVQCSQLGTDPDSLEKKLAEVLDHAVRWKAILLIDEADVYIHERGSDIQQNAVVGVFLRLLEYYSGVLFLTTNRATIVDDAIHSRVMAHVRYTIPEKADQIKIWNILASQYEVALSPDLVEALANAFPAISGRSIKQLVRLSKVLSEKRNQPITVELVKWISQFQDLEQTDSQKNGK